MKKYFIIIGVILVGIAIAISARIYFTEDPKTVASDLADTDFIHFLEEGKVQEVDAVEATDEDVYRAAKFRGKNTRRKHKIKKPVSGERKVL